MINTKFLSTTPIKCIFFVLTLGLSSHSYAQEYSDDDSLDPPMDTTIKKDPNAVYHGIGLRFRYLFLPKSMIELFMEEASSGVARPGFGLEYVRRKRNFEFSVGLEYDKLAPKDGYFVERGGDALKDGTVDFIEFDGLSWVALDASFVYHLPLTDFLSLRYGGGIGIAYVSGEVIETDAACNGPNIQDDCRKLSSGQVNEKQDFFRFPPIFNAIAGVQFTPGKNIKVNLEMGLRTVFYTGVGVQYFF